MSDSNVGKTRSKTNARTSSSVTISEEKRKSGKNLSNPAYHNAIKKSKTQGGLVENKELDEGEEENKEDIEEISEEDEQVDEDRHPSDAHRNNRSYNSDTQTSDIHQNTTSYNFNQEQNSSSSRVTSTQIFPSWMNWIIGVLSVIALYLYINGGSDPSSINIDWRLKVDPNNTLSNDQQSMVRASLKPILDESSARNEGVSTLLILSVDEENAAKIARCILRLVNTETHKDQVSTEIDLQSYRRGKLGLDSDLKSLLIPGGTVRAVLLRHIDKNPSNDAFEQLRLLFAYCDGENPVVLHRLIIMTAASDNQSENGLREQFKTRWPKEHDFVDALMSRISGHTLYVENNQKSIC